MARLTGLNEKLAIAMWDTGWLTRHYKYGSFENWDTALDGLVERGYNAIRIDAFPHLAAKGPDGVLLERFYRSRGKDLKMEHPWRNAWGTYLEPRKGLLEFLPKCKERGVKVGLSTWFPDVREGRHEAIQGIDEFVRIWDETLRFLDEHGLLDNIIYVDLLNEYPLWHDFEWLHLMLKTMSIPKPQVGRRFNQKQFGFYDSFATESICRLKILWPKIDFFFCFTRGSSVAWSDMNLKEFAALDVHVWFVQNPDFANSIGYHKIHDMTGDDEGYENCMKALEEQWPARKNELSRWIYLEMKKVSDVGKKLSIPYGNTEGWGPINWREHPLLNWDFLKEAGKICATFGSELGYKFNCSSNFTHPQFAGLWNDIAWHKEVTSIIKG